MQVGDGSGTMNRQVPAGFLPHVTIRNALVTRFQEPPEEVADCPISFRRGKQDVCIQKYARQTDLLRLAREGLGQFSLAIIKLPNSIAGIDFQRKYNRRPKQQSLRRRLGNEKFLAGYSQFLPQLDWERDDSTVRYGYCRCHALQYSPFTALLLYCNSSDPPSSTGPDQSVTERGTQSPALGQVSEHDADARLVKLVKPRVEVPGVLAEVSVRPDDCGRMP